VQDIMPDGNYHFQYQINPQTDFGQKLLSTVGKQVTKQPEVHIQMTVPNQFQKKGKFSIGITAGIESTLAPKDWIDGCNRMDLIIVPSEFSKKVLEGTVYDEKINKLVESDQVVDNTLHVGSINTFHSGATAEIAITYIRNKMVSIVAFSDDADSSNAGRAIAVRINNDDDMIALGSEVTFESSGAKEIGICEVIPADYGQLY